MTTVLLLLAAVATLAAAGFFAGAETGFLSVGRQRVLHLARAGGRKAQIVQRALADMSRTTTTLLIGNNLASVSYSSVSSALVLKLCEGSAAQAAGSLLAAFLVLYVSEFLPKLLCSTRPLARLLALAPTYRVAEALLRPLASLALALTNLFVPHRETRERPTAADILRILEDRRNGVCLTDFESALVGRILTLRAKKRPVTPEELLKVLDE